MSDEKTIVISGLAGRFPETDNVDQLWDELLKGKVLYSEERNRHPKKLRHRPTALGQIKDLSHFDANFFGFTSKEAQNLGTQTRVLHEVVYEAFWDAGLQVDLFRGSRVGFFLGISAGDGPDLYELDEVADPVYIFGRMAHHYDWKGPCVSIDTACASTLDAIIQAHWHLRAGLCELAVVAGVNTVVDPFVNVTAADIKMLSRSGFERCLDENADGFVRSETIAVVILQPKEKAKRVYGEILGASVNNDGYTEEGITFPNRHAQAEAMRSALKFSGISPSSIDYIEAHITGTQAGDAVETSAILDAYRQHSDQPIRIGCIKSNIGHGEASAGINAVIRACKILQTGYLSPNAAYEIPNSRISGLTEGKIIPVLTKQPLNSTYLGVNTFGFGGANGHLILKGNTQECRPIDLSTYPRCITFCNRTLKGMESTCQLLSNVNSLSEDLIQMLIELSKTKPESGLTWRGFVILANAHGEITMKKVSPVARSTRKLGLILNNHSNLLSLGLKRFKVFNDSLRASLSFLKTKGIDLTDLITTASNDNNQISTTGGKDKNVSLLKRLVNQLALIDLLTSLGLSPDLLIDLSSDNMTSNYVAKRADRSSVLIEAIEISNKSSSSKSSQSSTKTTINTSKIDLQKYSALLRNGTINSTPDIKGHVTVLNGTCADEIDLTPEEWSLIYIDGEASLIGATNTQGSAVDDEVNRFLAILGNLYLRGVNINLETLYPVTYPVGWRTPSLSPHLVWDRSEKFKVCSCVDFYENMTNLTFEVDLTDPEYEEVAHHVYDERILMPAVGYIYLLWKTMVFTIHGDSVDFRNYGFRVWEVRIHRATIINDSAVFKVFYNPVTHKFNVAFRDQVCVSGFGCLTGNVLSPASPSSASLLNSMSTNHSSVDFESYMDVYKSPEALEMDGDRFYLGLKIQGFQYGSKLRNIISTTTDHTYARIKYSGGWIGLADSFVQLGGLSTAQRTPRVPTGFQEMIYEPESFTEALEMIPVTDESPTTQNEKGNPDEMLEETRELEIFLCHEIGTITTYGFYLKGLQFTGAPLKPEQPDLRYARQVFKPYHCLDSPLPEASETLVNDYFVHCNRLMDEYGNQLSEVKEEWTNYIKFDSRYKVFNLIYKSITEPFDLKRTIESDSSVLIADYALNLALNHVLSFNLNVYESELSKKLVNLMVIGLHERSLFDVIVQRLSSFAVRVEDSPIIDQMDMTKKEAKPVRLIDLCVYNHSSLGLGGLNDNLDILNSSVNYIEPGNFLIVNYREKVLPFEVKLLKALRLPWPGERNHDCGKKIKKRLESAGFLTISSCRHETSGLISILFKRRPKLPDKPPRVINISGTSYGWVDDVQAGLDDKEVERLWLVGNDSNRNGIVGLVKCLRFEPFGDKIRCLFWPGRRITDDLNRSLGLAIVEKDLLLNVNVNGIWGVYHLDDIPIDEDILTRSTNCYVDAGKKGDLTSLAWYKGLDDDGSNALADEIEDHRSESSGESCQFENVNTYYSTLNFRDILLATGRLTADAYPPNAIETLIGTEFSGLTEITGRRVMGICHGRGIATSIPGKNISILFDVPDHWGLAEAATVPNVYLTVYYALCIRGGLRPGESVLIHSGSGGVGQAAISLCLSRGCQVFTTVSTHEKRRFLQSLFPQLVDSCFADSRSVQFEEHILRCTEGRGVDLVLNSLTEDRLQSGLRCIAEGGRFLELGKYDIIQNNDFDHTTLRSNCSFQVVCLSFVINKICENSWEGRQLAEQFRKFFITGIETGEIRPLTSTVFNSSQSEDAFRLMAKSRHLGKVLIQIRDEVTASTEVSSHPGSLEPIHCIRQTYFHPHKCYIIVGGLGGMGLELAYWLVARGARNLVITSRSGFKSDNERGFIEFLRQYQHRRQNIIVTINDAMSPTLTTQLIESASRLGPIGGIFNLAMVLKDGLFENQTTESFELVCGPKIKTTTNLDKISRSMCPYLDHFVCFSSIATLGSVGQSNYAFANSFMERVCEERRSAGLPGLAVQWGPVADVGVAARLVNEKDLLIFGFAAQNIFSCFRALDKFMQLDEAAVCQSCVLSAGGQQETPLFEDIFSRIAHILGIKDFDALDQNTTLNELGLDSLQSIEVKEYFNRQYNLSLDEKPLGSLKIADIRDLSKNIKSKATIQEEALD